MKKNILSIISLSLLLTALGNNLFAECRIGFLIPTTGEYASSGEECSFGKAVAMQRHESLKMPIKFFTEDSKAQGREAVTQFKKLVDVDQVQAIQLLRSPVGMAVNPLSKNAKIPVIGAVGHPRFVAENPYAFQFWPSTNDESNALAKAVITDKQMAVYSLSTEDDWLLAFQDDFNKNIKELGGTVVASENVEPSFVDFRSLILKIKQAKVDSVFMGFGPSQLNIFIKQFREAGLKHKLYGPFYVKSQDVIKALPIGLLEDITFVEIDVLKPIFVEKYAKLSNNQIPSAVSYTCYLTTEALYQTCGEHLETGASFQDILNSIKSVTTYDQIVTIDQRQAKFDIVNKKFKNGEVVTLK